MFKIKPIAISAVAALVLTPTVSFTANAKDSIENLSLGATAQLASLYGSKKFYQPQLSKDAKVLAGQYLVMFKPDASKAAMADVMTKTRALNKSTAEFKRYHAIKGFAATLNKQQLKALLANDAVMMIEPNVQYQVQDLGLRQSPLSFTRAAANNWAVDRLDQATLPLDGQYSPYYDGSGANVYILSSGIRTSHVEFGSRASHVFTAPDISGDNDVFGYGTYLAGLVGGNSYGVAPNANLYGVKVVDDNGVYTTQTLSDGMEYLFFNAKPTSVVYFSLSMPKSTFVDGLASGMAIEKVVVAPSGDQLRDACNYSPGAVQTVLTVAATWQDDRVSHYSNKGECVDVYAPGLYVKSAWNSTDFANNTYSHSPVAAALAAGAAALVYGNEPHCLAGEVSQKVIDMARPFTLTNVPADSPDKLLRVLTSADQGGYCTAEPLISGQSCAAILADGKSVGSQLYLIDPDGPNTGVEPFQAYCDMDTLGGGWTLVANHDRWGTLTESNIIDIYEESVLNDARWQAMRDNMTEGMMFMGYQAEVATISKAKLYSGNCTHIGQVDSLINNSTTHSVLWHQEDDGNCLADGNDFSAIFLSNDQTLGANLSNYSAYFDAWPYNASISANITDGMLYFIK